MTTKEKDFVEIDYIGIIKISGKIFDITNAEEAKKNNIFNDKIKYGSKVVCIGEQLILPALEHSLLGKKQGDEYEIELNPDKAFGNKQPKLISTIPTSALLKQKINPFPGLQINAGGSTGVIRSVTGGRTTVDFNHPLAGKTIIYKVKIIKIVTDVKEKIKGILDVLLGLKNTDYTLEDKDKKIEIKTKNQIPDQLKKAFNEKIKGILPEQEAAII